MKYIIDEELCSKKGITVPELLLILLVKTEVDLNALIAQMLEKEVLVKDLFGKYFVTQAWNDKCCDVLLTAEKDMPSEDKLQKLAISLMEIFPAGKKEGTTSTYWKGNSKDIKLRLKKFFKLYGSKYTDEQIISAAKSYVSSFNGNYTYMRVLKYFIWKDERKIDSEGKMYIEETSDLATFIENEGKDADNNWNTTLI